MTEKTYTTFQAAAFFGVKPTTVIKWAQQNKIKAYATLGGHRRFQESDLLEFMKKYQMPIPEELGGRSKTVIIVEDDPPVGRLLQRFFERADKQLKVLWFDNGTEALISIGKNLPDLVVLDVVMPGIDGQGVLTLLRANVQSKQIKVIGITGKKLPPEKLKFMRQYTDAFYFKPFDVTVVIEKAKSLLGISKNV